MFKTKLRSLWFNPNMKEQHIVLTTLTKHTITKLAILSSIDELTTMGRMDEAIPTATHLPKIFIM